MLLSRSDEIWNRACLEGGGKLPAAGDRALASLLLAHGLAMNGGVVHALQCMSKLQTTAAVAGFNYFNLTAAARVFQQCPDESEETEELLNQMYWAAVSNDATLDQALQVKLLRIPAIVTADSGRS